MIILLFRRQCFLGSKVIGGKSFCNCFVNHYRKNLGLCILQCVTRCVTSRLIALLLLHSPVVQFYSWLMPIVKDKMSIRRGNVGASVRESKRDLSWSLSSILKTGCKLGLSPAQEWGNFAKKPHSGDFPPYRWQTEISCGQAAPVRLIQEPSSLMYNL